MTTELSFTTFLKVASLPSTVGRAGLINRLHTGEGGYDFYKRLKAAAQSVALDINAADDVLGKLASIKKDAERIHNLLMARRFLTWWQSLVGAKAYLSPPKGIYTRDDLKFGVRLRPELCYEQAGQKFVTYLYATKMPKLTRHVAGEGLLMLRDRLGQGSWGQARFQILDLRQERVFSDETCITNSSASYLNADLAFINSIWPDALPKAA